MTEAQKGAHAALAELEQLIETALKILKELREKTTVE